MYFIGIDISKYKHNCHIVTSDGEIIVDDLVITNDSSGFSMFESILSSLDKNREKRIGFESTGHYDINLKLFLEKNHHSFMEFNPLLLSQYTKARTLRRTKTDTLDCRAIAHYLMTVEYKPYPTGFYHMYSLKSLTRTRNSLIRQRSRYLVEITNVLDHIFPEYKIFFGGKFTSPSLYLLNRYPSVNAIANMKISSFESVRKATRGKITADKFIHIRELARNTVGETNENFELELKIFLDLHKHISEKIKLIEDQITCLMKELNPPTMSIPGVGIMSAASIVAEFGDISRFKGPSQMLSFAGLEPGYYQSGLSETNGKMVKRGSPQLRCTIMNVCLPLSMHNPVMTEYYYKKRSEGKPHRVALSHVAKKLIRIIYALETQHTTFDPAKLR